MHKVTHLRCRVLAWSIALGLTFCAQSEAQKLKALPVGKVVLQDDGELIILNIGRRRNLAEGAEGNAASLRALARLIQKYPKGHDYVVKWSVKAGRGPLNMMFTDYIKSQQSVQRGSATGSGKAGTINGLQYDGIAKEELLRVVRRGGSFRELDKVAVDYSQGQQYWR